MRLRALARLDELLIRRVRVAPTEILLDGAREEHVLLQHDGDLIAQAFKVVILDVYAADEHLALGRVVKTGNEVDQRGLGTARAAQNAHGLPRFDPEVDAGEGVTLRLFGILEADVPELHAAVRHFVDGLLGVGEGALFVEHFRDALRGRGGDGDHHHDHGERHERGHALRTVGDEAGKSLRVEVGAARLHDDLGAEDAYGGDRRPDGELHERAVERDDHLAALEVRAHVLRRTVELVALVVLTHVGFHHSDALDVLLDGLVHRVVFLEHLREDGVHLPENEEETHAQHGDDGKENERDLPVDGEGHDDGHHQHDGAAHRDADDHHERILDVDDVRGHPRDQAGRRKFVDVGKGKALHGIVDVRAQVLGKARRRLCRIPSRQHPEQQRDRRHQEQDAAPEKDVLDGVVRLDLLQHRHHIEGYETLHHHLERHKHGRKNGLLPELPEALCQSLYHIHTLP